MRRQTSPSKQAEEFAKAFFEGLNSAMSNTKRKSKVQVRKGIVRYYYVILASNGQVMSVSQKYFSESNASRAAKKVAENNNMRYEPYEPKQT